MKEDEIVEVPRCKICDWPLAESREKGCVEGDCSFRPDQGSPEWYRIQERRAMLSPTPEQKEGMESRSERT